MAKVGMPILFFLAAVLVGAVLTLPPQPGIGTTAVQGFRFIYGPDPSRLGDPEVWLAAAGQIFFTLSVGMGSLQAYASYLSTRDDIALNGLATAATNETAEVVLGGSIAIPVGHLLGTAWFSLLFFAGITSSVAMLTPIVAFFREEFGARRKMVAWSLGAGCFAFGLMDIAWWGHGFLDEGDYWAGTFGLVVVAVLETVVFVWIFGPERAWASIHQGADIRIPGVFRFVMTYVTPLYLMVILGWWGATEAMPILLNQRSAGSVDPVAPGDLLYVNLSRGVILLFAVAFVILVRMAWKRNGYDDRKGFSEVHLVAEGGEGVTTVDGDEWGRASRPPAPSSSWP